MEFHHIFYGGGGLTFVDSGIPRPGVLYAIDRDGRLLWYEDELRNGKNSPDGSGGWAPRSQSQIGTGWGDMLHVTSAGDGIIYAIHRDGRLLWYQDELRDGTNAPDGSTGWNRRSQSQIGTGWQDMIHFFSSGPRSRTEYGDLYAVHRDGRLLWYRDIDCNGTNAPDGSTGWAEGSGNQIGTGFQDFKHLFGLGGQIYGIHNDGRLLFYRDDMRDGKNAPDGSTGWSAHSGSQIGTGWQDMVHATHGSAIYAVHNDGRLLWYRDELGNGTNAPDGTTGWAVGSGNQIGVGWN